MGIKRAWDEHDGSCKAIKSYAAGSKYCSTAGRKDYQRKSIYTEWNVHKNLCREIVTRQKNYLLKILKIPVSDPRDHLKRGGIVEKIRNKYQQKDAGGGEETN